MSKTASRIERLFLCPLLRRCAKETGGVTTQNAQPVIRATEISERTTDVLTR